MNEDIPWSWCCTVKSLFNDWIFTQWTRRLLAQWLNFPLIGQGLYFAAPWLRNILIHSKILFESACVKCVGWLHKTLCQSSTFPPLVEKISFKRVNILINSFKTLTLFWTLSDNGSLNWSYFITLHATFTSCQFLNMVDGPFISL